ncbi:MAG: HAD family hydrolase [Candidatus Thorarchaeota archaeon]|nr:HAD family hydrolase [Candidatus Thorarchaeota archaeon]
MLKAVVFDLDGTLTVLNLPLEAMRKDTKAYFISKGVPTNLFEPADGISSSTTKAREYFLSTGMFPDVWKKHESEMDAILDKHEASATKQVTLMEDTVEVINGIKDLGLKTAILTNNGRGSVNAILEQVELGGLFDVIQTRHESPRAKPFPDGLLKIVARLDVERDEAIYVGDAGIDAVAAMRAGVEFWGVTTGEIDRESLLGAGAAMTLESLSHVLAEVRNRIGVDK